MSQATPKALSKDDIIKATAQDATLQEVMRLISNGQLKWPVEQPEASE